jgi:hypothetical protein
MLERRLRREEDYMTISEYDNDPVWCTNNKPIKVWATSKISYNRYIDDAKIRFNLLCGPDIPLTISEIDHIEIVRNEAKYYFKKPVSNNPGQFLINEQFYVYCDKCISAYDLKGK